MYDGASVRTGESSSATETDGGNTIEETDDDDDDDDDEKRWTGYEKELFNEVWYNCLFGTLQRIVPKCLTPVSRGNGFMCACDLVKLWSLCGISPVNVPALIDEQLLSCDLISPCHAKLKSAYLECSGLVNLGATCYMNSVLQQLYMIPAFREGVLGLNLTGHKDEYLWELQKLFTQMHSGISKSVSTAGLVKKLKIGGHPIDTSVQMDAMELFEAVVSKTSYDVRALQQNNSQADFVDDIFGYKSCKMIIPSGCPHTRESLTSSTSISLSIKGKPTLQMSLADLVKGERLVGDNQFMCDACAQKRDTLMRECFYTTPNVLVVQCKRFEFNHFVDMSLKVNDYFEAPMSFSMWPYTKAGLEAANEERGNDGDDDSYTYDLVGFVVHSGVACGGHYYSYIKNRNGGSDDGSWIKFDDTDLSPSSFESMPQYLFGGSGDTNAYLLFYQKRSWKAPQQPQQALAASPTYKAFYDDVLNRNRLLMKADVLLSSSFVVFIENMFLRSGAPLSNAINYDMILHIFLTIVHKIDEVPQAKDYCSDAYHYVQVSSMALWQHALENACKVHPGFLDCFLFSSPDNAVSFLWKYLAETPQQNAHFAFASVIATKISTLAGLAQTNAIASCLSLIDNVCKRDKNPAGLFVLYKLLARSGPATAQALLNGHVLGLLASVGLFSESSSDWASCKTKVGLYIDSFVDAIVSVLAAVRDWTLSVPEEDFDKLLEKSFHKDVTSISYDAEVVLLKALLAVVSGENNTMLFGNCLGAVLCMTYDGSLLGILLESVLPYFEPHADELDPLRASIFMQVFVEEEGERIKKKNKDPYKNLLEAVSSRLVDPERFPAVADWLFANFGKWLYLFLVRPTLPSIRADGLSLLFRAVGCNEPTSEPLTEPQVLRLRATLDYILHNFADLTKAMDHMHIKYLALSKVFMVCTRPEVHATNIVDRASVHTLIEFVGIVNKSEYMYEETDWDADARFVIMRFLVTLAQSPDGKDTIPEYIADSPHLSDFFRLVGPRTTLDASNPSSADEPISDMCTLASFVLACRPQALAAFFPNSNAFTWLLRAILFSELRVSAPGARAAVAGLVRDMLASTGDLGVATGRKLGAVFAALCSTPLDCVVSAINNTVLSLGSDLPDASLAAFCGGGAFDFMRAVLCCHCTDEGIVDFICSFLLVISTRKGSPQALLGRPECKDATYALALDVALSASRDVDIWTALAPMLPDPELFVAALWKRLVRDLPQGRDAYSGVADAFIAEEAKKEGPTPKCASFVQLYNAVFFGAAQDSADASLLFIGQHVTPQMAQIFVVEVFNSPATRIGPAPTEGVVVAMQKVVANIPEPEKLALNFVGCLTSKPCRECQWTEDEKRLWLRRARMLLTLFGDFIEGYTAQDLLSFMISIDCEKSDIHNEISLLKNMCVDEKNNLKK